MFPALLLPQQGLAHAHFLSWFLSEKGEGQRGRWLFPETMDEQEKVKVMELALTFAFPAGDVKGIYLPPVYAVDF